MKTTRRNIAKFVSYRFFGTLATIELASAIDILATLFKTVVYSVQEQVWNQTPYGREQQRPKHFI